MPITREPSQRALNWVRWNSSKSSVSSLKSNSPTEIIHLGGSRVGAPIELDPPAPDRSRPGERPITTWAFNGPPPAPPSVGIARSVTAPIAEISQTPTELYPPGHNERPITQWYSTEWQPPAKEQADNGFKDQGLHAVSPGLNPPPLKIAAPRQAPAAPSTSSPSPTSPLPSSAIFTSSSYSSSNLSAPRRRSPVPPRYTASSLSQSSTGEETSEEPGRAPNDAPASPLTPKEENALSVPTEAFTNLRRTQSHADIQTRSHWKALPPRPLGDGRDSEAYNKEYGKQHAGGQLIRSNTSPSGVLRVFPPQANAPPKNPLPAISEKTGAWGGSTVYPGSRHRPADPNERRKERSPPRQVTRSSPPPPPPPPHPYPHQGQQGPQQQQQQIPLQQAPQPRQKPPKLTPRERLWLHRNYRGEATFLRAWGLQISNEEEREEGLTILRELMASEAEEDEKEERRRQQLIQQQQQQQQQQQYHTRSASASAALPPAGPAPPPPKDGAGLGVIVEERSSREYRVPPTKESLGYTAVGVNASGQEVWRKGGDGDGHHHHQNQRLMIPIDGFNARRVDKHARSESDSSVLGAYLDVRMSRLDD
ncbi:hypothetical protein F5X99DRAFT_268921 [Biscogniauxia marginata]|nr:hypothetical protein F5X99DRAFT_268921 [Biscogniauxia marginata]